MAGGWLVSLALPALVPALLVAFNLSPSVSITPVITDIEMSGQDSRSVWPDTISGVSRNAESLGISQALSAQSPFSIDIERSSSEWPYSVALVLSNDVNLAPWYVTVEVVGGDYAPLPEGITVHTRVTPVSAELGQPFMLSSGLAQRVALFFDPSQDADLETLSRMCVLLKWGRQSESMTGAGIYRLDFLNWSSLEDSGFRLEEDGYRFENVGDCYGMCSTAALYYTSELTRPGELGSTFALDRGEALTAIVDYQSSHLNSIGTITARLRGNAVRPGDVLWLQQRIRADVPVVAWLTRSRVGGAHAVLVRGLLLDDARNVGMLTIYDPDHSYASTREFNLDAFNVIRFELSSGHLFHGEYSGFAFGQAAVIPGD